MMKNKKLLLFLIGLLALFVAGCGFPGAGTDSAPEATPNTQATIDAAVAATDAARAASQATINAAVAATDVAQAATAEAETQATGTATTAEGAASEATDAQADEATTASSEEYVTMTEDELTALIDAAVTEAVVASEAYSTAATEAAADNTVTQDEVQTVEVYFANADEAIAYAEDLMGIYYGLYGELAVETVDELQELEDDLEEIAYAVNELNEILTDIDSTLAQGLALAEETVSQVQTTAQTISDKTAITQAAAETWQSTHQTEQDNRIATVVAVQASQINGEPQVAVQSVLEFAQTGQAAIADNQITAAELAELGQLAANAGASLEATGTPQLQDLSGVVSAVSEHIAGGNLPQAQAGLDQLGIAAPLALPPNQVAQEPRAAIESALAFASASQQIVGGNSSASPVDLANLAQMGANASASLNASGIAQLQQLSGTVTEITGQISVGRNQQAQLHLDQLAGSLQSVPNIELPSIEKPSIEKPSLPGRSGRSSN